MLAAERIDHGVRSLEDPDLVARLVRDRIPLTVCPFSNVRLKVCDTLAEHPLKRMLDAGLAVTINSDDPAYFGGYVGDNWRDTVAALDLGRDDIVRIARNGIDAAFVDEASRRQMHDRLDDHLAAFSRAPLARDR